jgi:hypothetical protein
MDALQVLIICLLAGLADRRAHRTRRGDWRKVRALARAEGRPAPRYADDWDRRGRPRPPGRRAPRSRLDHWRHVCALARAEGRPAPHFTGDWDRRDRPRP